MKMLIRMFLKALCVYDYEKYWSRREKLFADKLSRIKRKWYTFYIYSCNEKMNADIPIPKDNNFQTRPQNNNHGLNGIVIAGGGEDRKKMFYFPSSHNRKKYERCS